MLRSAVVFGSLAWCVILAGVLVSPLIPLAVFGGLAVFVFVTGERAAWQRKR
jgi:hypothetical protein